MTNLEIVFMLIIWVFVGCFICYKRKWYKPWASYETPPSEVFCALTIICAPLSLVIAIFRELVLDDWNNE